MASLQKDNRTGNWIAMFWYGGKQFRRSTETTSQKDALSVKARVEDTIRFLKTGRLTMPAGADPATFIISDGKLVEKPRIADPDLIGLGEICTAYLADQHSKAETTLVGEKVHINHLKRTLGENAKLSAITTKDLQDYVNKRTKKKYRGKATSGKTIRKELVTLTQIWAWARQRKYVNNECPVYDDRHKWAIEIAKPAEREKFQTWDQIEKRINRGGLTAQQQADLWAVLFLDNDQIIELLKHAKKFAKHDFVYPMFMFAAYTGARRSEIRRSLIEDFDFENARVKIREKKRKKTKSESYRFVDLHPRLADVMKEWFAKHPGGQFTIVAPLIMAKRSTRKEFIGLSQREAHHHFHETLANSKWKVVRGFHVLRHSFGSNLARAGVEREQIAAWMGHTTAQMMDLYQHLFPQDGSKRIAALR